MTALVGLVALGALLAALAAFLRGLVWTVGR